MPGELEEGHFGGQLVVVERRLWMFMGAPVYATNVGHKAVESYGTDQRGWIREPDADVEVGVYVLGAAVFDGTKEGRFAACIGRFKSQGTRLLHELLGCMHMSCSGFCVS